MSQNPVSQNPIGQNQTVTMLPRPLREECGVVGIWGSTQASQLAYLCLHALQHRGQEACGIVSSEFAKSKKDNHPGAWTLHSKRAFGLVADTFSHEALESLRGQVAVGHVRYATHGGRMVHNIQPFYFNSSSLGRIAIAHNGDITNADLLRQNLEAMGSLFTSTSDTEVIMHLLARESGDMRERIQKVMPLLHGAFSLVILVDGRLFAVRDSFGFRPLVLGRLEESESEADSESQNDGYVIASETCALDLIGAAYMRDIEAGEILEIGSSSSPLTSSAFEAIQANPKKRKAFCAFEPIYFSRPDSHMLHREIYDMRCRMGAELAVEAPTEADLVIAVPDSGVPMAMGYSKESGLPLELGFVRNHYMGRTFIQPMQNIRDFWVKIKLNPVKSVLKDKRVIVIDDSLVRGTTSVKIMRMLRKAGVKEIHLRIGSPPITHSCFFGVDTPTRAELLAAQKNVKEIKKYIDCDSIGFLSLEGLKRALGSNAGQQYCFGCFSGDYPDKTFAPIPEQPTDKTGTGLKA